MFFKTKKDLAAIRRLEEKIYEIVVQEVAEGKMRYGLWAKALADSGGMQEKAKALYLRYRAQSLMDEFVDQMKAINQEVKTKKRQGKKIPTKDPEYVRCSICGFEQWRGYEKCQKCGVMLLP